MPPLGDANVARLEEGSQVIEDQLVDLGPVERRDGVALGRSSDDQLALIVLRREYVHAERVCAGHWSFKS